MRLKTPSFWYKPTISSHGKAWLLSPLAWIYNGARTRWNARIEPQKAPLPVICVGNFVAGGSGKTPVCMALMDLVKKHGLAGDPAFLTRGYGGSLRGPVRVDAARHGYQQVGDEALLLTRHGPVYVARKRLAGVQEAAAAGHDLVILDDGLQNYSLRKNLSFAVVDTDAGLGNGKLLPAGPLRAPAEETLSRADALIMTGQTQTLPPALRGSGLPVFSVRTTVKNPPETKFSYAAFCGIARPEKFRRTLDDLGVNIVDFIPFPDHHPYSAEDLEEVRDIALALGLRLITTEKDAKRLPPSFIKKTKLCVLAIGMEFTDEEALSAFIVRKLKKKQHEKISVPA